MPEFAAVMTFSNIRLAIVCPMANEIETATDFVDDVIAVCSRFGFKSVFFFVVVDTVARDGTVEAISLHQRLCKELRVIWAPENRSVADAYLRGYREALSGDADWILKSTPVTATSRAKSRSSSTR